MSEEEVLPHAVVTDRDDGVAVTLRRDPRITAVPSAGRGGDRRRDRPPRRARSVRRFLAEPAHRSPTGRRSLARWRRASCPICAAACWSTCAPAACRASPAASCRAWCSTSARSARRWPCCPRWCTATRPARASTTAGWCTSRVRCRCATNPAERRLAEKLRADLSLLCGRRTTFEGADTARFVDKLKRWRGELAGDGAKLVGARVYASNPGCGGKLGRGDHGSAKRPFRSRFHGAGRGQRRSGRHGQRRGGAVGLARRLGPGAARRRRLFALARGVAGQARTRAGGLARRPRRRRPRGHPRPAHPRPLLRGSGPAPPAWPGSPGAPGRNLRAPARGQAAERPLPRPCVPTSRSA
jgi:hypothetical protein